MNPATIVILDSLNYIKGFRYQLYCAAKEAGVRVCTVCNDLFVFERICLIEGLVIADLRCSYTRSVHRMEHDTRTRQSIRPWHASLPTFVTSPILIPITD